MAALGWLLNLGFAAGTGAAQQAATVSLQSVNDGRSVSIPDSVRDDRFRVGIQGVSIRREIS